MFSIETRSKTGGIGGLPGAGGSRVILDGRAAMQHDAYMLQVVVDDTENLCSFLDIEIALQELGDAGPLIMRWS